MKKVLSIVLTMALVLTSFSMAFADTKTDVKKDEAKPAVTTTVQAGLSDIAKSANKEAIGVCYDLGIVTGTEKGTFEPTKAVTRAEFAAMITRALAIPASALKSSATSFKDVQGYGWAVPYLSFCNAKGIMLGDGRGNAMPGKTISLNEAVTMALRSIGYISKSAELVGMWPANYVTKGQEVGLYTDVPGNLDGLDKQLCAQVIYNLLTVQKVAVDKEGLTKGMTAKDGKTVVTLLNSGLGAEADKDAKTIEGTEASKINLKAYIGKNVNTYSKDKKIIAIAKVNSTTLEGEYVADGEFKVGEKTYKNIKKADINGAETKNFVNGVVKAIAAVNAKDEFVLEVKLDGTKVEKVFSAAKWEISAKAKAPKSIAEQVKAKSLLGKKFALDDSKNIDTKSFQLVGVESLDKIAEDNVVYVYTATVEGKEVITKVEVGTEVVTGKITKFADKKYTINDKAYKAVDAVDGAANLGIGKEVKVFLDASGAIYAAELVKGSYNYGVAQKSALEAFTPAVQILTTDKTVKLFPLAEKAKKNGLTDDKVANHVVKYALNKDGQIAELVAAEVKDFANAKFNSSRVLVDTDNADKQYVVDAKAAVFSKNEKGEYAVSELANIKTGKKAKVQAMIENGAITALIIDKAIAGGTSAAVYAVINSTADVLVGEETGVAITGLAGAAEYTANAEKVFTGANAINPMAIQLFKLEANASKIVTEATLVGDADTKKVDAIANAVTENTMIDMSADVNVKDIIAVSSKAVVYKAELNKEKTKYVYTVSYPSAILKGYSVWAFDTNKDGKDNEGVYDVIIYVAK